MLRSFGALSVEGTDEGGAKLESKTRSLVAALVVAKLGDTRSLGELTRDRLADLLWPDMSIDRAVNNLHATLSYARRFLGGSDTITQNDGVYEINDDVAIDAVEFRECVTKGNRLHSEGVYFGAAAAYRSAIELATGDFLEGMYAEWVDSVRESLRGELATALERLIAIELDRDNYAAVPRLAEKLLALDDLHDGAYEALIKSAAARGARREAFSYFNRYEAALDTYGAGPARRITELMSKVRAGEA
jgi:DNA-binding SARP family transcriptional activator